MHIALNISGVSESKQRITGIRDKMESAFDKLTKEVRVNLKLKSPVGKTKEFIRNWNIPPAKLFTFDIRNRMPYAEAIVYGCPVGEKPWPSAGKLTSEIGGRIWSNKMLENKPNIGTYGQTVLDEDRLQNRYDTLLREELKSGK